MDTTTPREELPSDGMWDEGGATAQEMDKTYKLCRARCYREPELIGNSVLVGKRRIFSRKAARLYLERFYREQQADRGQAATG